MDLVGGLCFKFGKWGDLHREASDQIPENEMPGMGRGIPKGGTYSEYGNAARKLKLERLKKRGAFARIPVGQIHLWASLIIGRFLYAIKNKPPFGGL